MIYVVDTSVDATKVIASLMLLKNFLAKVNLTQEIFASTKEHKKACPQQFNLPSL
jgi:hypothetical protein